MSEYDTIQNNYKESCKNRIKRQLQIGKNILFFYMHIEKAETTTRTWLLLQGSYRAWKTWKTLKTWKNTLILPQSGKSQGRKLGIEESQGKVGEFYK